MLTKNLNRQGRLVRLALALLVLAYAIWQNSWIALIASAFIFFEAYMSWCVLYQFLGINRCPIQKPSQTYTSDETQKDKK